MTEDHPIGAFVLSIIGAVLILVDGAVVLFAGASISGAGFPAAGGLVSGLGGLGVFLGIVIFLLALAIFIDPDRHTGYGISILTLSLLSILAGGGFVVGLILGVIGGILGIIFEPDEDIELSPAGYSVTTQYVSAPRPAPDFGQGTGPAPGSTGQSSGSLTKRACRNCGAVWPAAFTLCQKCGATL